ncbi:36584_t:CDS:1, partial [Racocetra persica]
MYNHKHKFDKNSFLIRDLAASLELPVITPTYLAAQPSASALADVSEKSHSSNHILGILVTIVVIILVIIIGIGSCIYYRRIKHGKKRNEEAQKYEPKNDVLEHHIGPQ